MTLIYGRTEFTCLIILTILYIYSYSFGKKLACIKFLYIATFALSTVLLDYITLYTVNNLSTVPLWVNNVLHCLYFLSAIGFAVEFYEYVLFYTLSDTLNKHLRIIKIAVLIVFILSAIMFPIQYVKGRYIYYSTGPLVIITYSIFAMLCIMSLTLLIVYNKVISKRIRRVLYPTISLMIFLMVYQIIRPEILITGSAFTIIIVGMFITLDNPASQYKKEANWDALTGIKNKHCYDEDISRIQRRYKSGKIKIGLMVADINGLKLVNDKYGHSYGNDLISITAQILSAQLSSAFGVYRIGGDEFVALYLETDNNIVMREIDNVRVACSNEKRLPIQLTVAIGYTTGECITNFEHIFNQADEKMYINKNKIKSEFPELFIR